MIEVDPGTGELIDTFPADSLRVGDEMRQFPDEITRIETVAGIALVVIGGDVSELPYVAGFDADGNELRYRQFLSSWFEEWDGTLVTMHEARIGAKTHAEHDPETGEPIAIHDFVFDTREQLGEYVPSRWQHLFDEYLQREEADR